MSLSLESTSAILEAAARSASRPAQPDWLRDARRHALAEFLRRGFPQPEEEDWRYTDLRDTATLALRHAARSEPGDTATAPPLPIRPSGMFGIVLHDGEFAVQEPPSCDLTLRRLSDRAPAASSTHFASPGDPAHPALSLLNLALLDDGLLIEVAPGARLAEPIHIACSSGAERFVQNRIVLQLGAGSQATVVEHHTAGANTVTNTVTNVRCASGASLAYVKIQEAAPSSHHLARQEFTIDGDARVQLTHIDIGASLARNDLGISLDGPGAAVEARGLFIADGDRHLDNHTRIDHRAPRTTSRELYRGIIDGAGRGVFNGKIVVHPGAPGTDARLQNQNLLLSESAEIDTKPELEIHTDDVRCSHGATTGQLDPLAIFYLRSRGLDAAEARRMLIASFAREMLCGLPMAATEERLLVALRDRLPEIALVGGRL